MVEICWMILFKERVVQGGFEWIVYVDWVVLLIGICVVVVLLVVGIYVVYIIGKYIYGYWGLMLFCMEIGVLIFFVLLGFLLFWLWVKFVVIGGFLLLLSCYVWYWVWWIMFVYIVIVLLVYFVYYFCMVGFNFGYIWVGLFCNFILMQIYIDGYLGVFLYQGLI